MLLIMLIDFLFRRTLLRYVRLMGRAVRLLSVVTLLHPTQRFERFGNILHHLIAQGLAQFV